MKDNPITHPSAGGSYVRNADGSLKQTAKSTAPSPGKTAIRREAATKVAGNNKRATEVAAPKENGNG